MRLKALTLLTLTAPLSLTVAMVYANGNNTNAQAFIGTQESYTLTTFNILERGHYTVGGSANFYRVVVEIDSDYYYDHFSQWEYFYFHIPLIPVINTNAVTSIVGFYDYANEIVGGWEKGPSLFSGGVENMPLDSRMWSTSGGYTVPIAPPSMFYTGSSYAQPKNIFDHIDDFYYGFDDTPPDIAGTFTMFLTLASASVSPIGGWYDALGGIKMMNYSSYQTAWQDGYDAGKQAGMDQYYSEGYEDGKIDGYNSAISELGGDQFDLGYQKGYDDAQKESFSAGLQKWIVPAIFLVLIGGGIFSIMARRRNEG